MIPQQQCLTDSFSLLFLCVKCGISFHNNDDKVCQVVFVHMVGIGIIECTFTIFEQPLGRLAATFDM